MKVGVALIAAALLAAGCGATEAGPRDAGEPAGTLEPAPPIQAVDEPAAPTALTWLDPEAHGEVISAGTVCSIAYASSGDSAEGPEEAVSKPCEDLSPEEREQFEEADRAFRALVKPASGSEPRTIAKLEAGDRVLSLIAWRSTAGLLCLADEVSMRRGGGGGGGPGGPCMGDDDPSCGAGLCLEPGGHGPPMRWRLTGMVSSQGEELRITLDTGAMRRYPLSGPVVPGFPEYRVFLLDLGQVDYTKLELLRAGVVVAAYDIPPWLLHARDCMETEADARTEECGPSAE